MKKLISIVLIILMIIGLIIIPTKSYASFSIDGADLYSKGVYSDYLHYGDIGIVFNYVVYSKDGIEYPAYCLNKDLDGVTGSYTYSVSTDELLSDVRVWRTIINGYPYKSAAELGCATDEEAFIATKQAVYCMIYGRLPDEYKANDEREGRVLNALKQIVTNANNTTQTKKSADLTITSLENEWRQDEVDEKHVSKTFAVLANAPISTYVVKLENINIEGIKIVDEQNNEKNEFISGQNFKILIPITNINIEGSFNINVTGQVATKPVLYGYSANRSFQDYAITGSIYEEGIGKKQEDYPKNKTKIIILKTNDNGEALEGVKFNLLNDKKEIVFLDLVTDEKGKILIENLSPGKYFIREVSGLNGYKKINRLVEVNVSYNEEQTITITNTKETIETKKPEIIEITEEPIRLPKTGM